MNGDREAVLSRVREALRVPAPRHHEKPAPAPSPLVSAPFREWLPPVGAAHEDRVALFTKLSEMLRTEFVDCLDFASAARHLAQLATLHGWQRVAAHRGELIDALCERVGWGTAEPSGTNRAERDSSPQATRRAAPATGGEQQPVPAKVPLEGGASAPPALLQIGNGYEKTALEACDAGLTECECLVAQTGSVCVTTYSSGGRALSVLPPHHVVIARRAQLLADLTAAYELLARKYTASGYPSFLGFITGPSRTGDIERILVLGAHGPKKLTVLLVP